MPKILNLSISLSNYRKSRIKEKILKEAKGEENTLIKGNKYRNYNYLLLRKQAKNNVK